MITEETNPEMIVQINADGDVISDLMSPIDGSFCERRVPGGIGMCGSRKILGNGIRSINFDGILNACQGTRL